MIKPLALSLYLMGCSTRFLGIPEEVDEVVDQFNEKESDPIYVRPVEAMHWQCCTDLCKGAWPKSVLKELDTSYIICECKNGKVFRVTRLKG